MKKKVELKSKLLILGLMALSLPSLGSPRTILEVHCRSLKDSGGQTIRLKIDQNGNIVPWSRDRLIMASPKSPFRIFLLSPWSYTSVQFLKHRNHTFVKVHTGQARAEIRITSKLNSGHFEYVDLSGSEDLQIPLECSPKSMPRIPTRGLPNKHQERPGV